MNKVDTEIPYDDQGRAQQFYQDVFGWQITKFPDMDYHLDVTTPSDEKTGPKEQGLAVYAMNFDDDGILLASVNTFGLVRSNDLGESWEDLPNINLTITSIAFDSPNKIL